MRLPLARPSLSAREKHHIAEVIETSTTEFLAQCLDPDDLKFPAMPAFGSWVQAKDEETGNRVYAIVYHATTSPIDSVHRARALGMSLDDLKEQQPQIFAMLKTEFRAAIVGYRPEGDRMASIFPFFQHLPPRPPQIHQAVYNCDNAEIVAFSEQFDFLRTLLQINGAPTDALTAAAIREIYQLRQADREWLVQAGRMLNLLLKDDYDRLRVILSQVHI